MSKSTRAAAITCRGHNGIPAIAVIAAVAALVSSPLLGLSLALAAGDDSSLELTARRLIRELDAPRLNQRETAERELLDLGPAILEMLPRPGDRVSAEIQQRSGRIRQTLEQRLAEAATAPSRVSLAGTMPLAEVLSKIEEQTGNRVVLQQAGIPAAEQQVTVDFEKALFWQAIDELSRQAGLSVYPYGEERGIALVARPAPEPAAASLVSYSGAFRIEAIRILAQRDLRVNDSGSLRLSFEIAWEPRLSPISLQQPMDAMDAVDEKGNPLLVNQKKANIEVPIAPLATAAELMVPLELPPREVKRIARLNGVLKALVPGRIEMFRFEGLAAAKNVEKRAAGVTVKLEQVRKNNMLREVRIRVGYDEPAGSMASHRTWMFDNEAYLEGPDGKKVRYDAFETTWQSENEFGIAYLFGLEEPLDDFAFVYKTPGRILANDFRYEIGDVALP